ncbi:hypothetical protein NMY22_g9747 [Coprinellus aureogranulatus]|nr:hypothetical protein NMY22_g9747 [Coprinellus aureogranulatus]
MLQSERITGFAGGHEMDARETSFSSVGPRRQVPVPTTPSSVVEEDDIWVLKAFLAIDEAGIPRISREDFETRVLGSRT